MIYRISHVTRYDYSGQVSSCHNLAHLLPRNTDYQRVLDSRLLVSPLPVQQQTRFDYFGNLASHFSIESLHQWLEITAQSDVEVDAALRDALGDPGLDLASTLDRLRAADDIDTLHAREYRLDSPLVRAGDWLADYARPLFAAGVPLLEAAGALTAKIHDEFTYDPHFTSVSTPLAEAVEHRRGVCQDFAHVAIGCLRSLGLAARYVSGYMETHPPPGQPKLRGADASHAWFAVFAPGLGWAEFDPTNGQRANSSYVTAAWGRDYSDVTPLKGVIFGGGESHELAVAVDMDRVG